MIHLALAGAIGCVVMGGSLQAQLAWPVKPIRIIVPFLAGGPTDVTTRVIAQAIGPD